LSAGRLAASSPGGGLAGERGAARWWRVAAAAAALAALLGAAVAWRSPDHSHLPEPLRPYRAAWLVLADALCAFALWALERALGLRASLHAEDLLRSSEWLVRLSDWDDASGSFREGLSRLGASLEGEAELTALGRVLTWVQMTTLLGNRLKVVEYGKRHAQVASERVAAPVFIVGMPRSGTTFLHNLLMFDPQFRAPRLWEIQDPVPPTDPGQGSEDPRSSKFWRVLSMNLQLRVFHLLQPSLHTVHSVEASNAEECMPILAMDARSLLFNVLYFVPRYQEWLMTTSSLGPMRFHRRYLQTLQTGQPRGEPRKTWLLKTPWHMFTLEALWTVYPDARIIMPHRDPAGMVASLSSLHTRFNGICTDQVRPHAIGAFQKQQWEQIVDAFMATRARHADKAAQVVDAHFDALARDPLAAVAAIYRSLGLELSAEATANMRGYLNGTAGDGTGKRGAHGTHEYRLEWFGLSEQDLEAVPAFARYCEHYGVARKFRHSSEIGK
jgi:hypothetical protein